MRKIILILGCTAALLAAGCDQQYGTSSVSLGQKNCSLVACPSAPQGCSWQNTLDAYGCPSGCGSLQCNVGAPPSCGPAIDCAQPPVGCRYLAPVRDVSGCVTSCGMPT